jgi:hypothetical protein
VSRFGKLAPQPTGEGGWSPKDNLGRPVIVKVKGVREGIVTANSGPEGATALVVDLVDLTNGEVHRDSLWFSGAVVDGLTPHIGGQPIVIQFVNRTSKSGRPYPVAESCPENVETYADQWIAQNGDPFVELGRLEPAPAPAPAPAERAPGTPSVNGFVLPWSPPTTAAPAATPVPGPAPTAAPAVAKTPVPAAVYAAMVNSGMDVSTFTAVP